MKKLLLVLAALCATAWGQIDIPITTVGPNRTIAPNFTWAGSGVGALNNNYVMTPNYPNEGLCLYVANNDTVQHTYSLQFFSTGNQDVTTFTGNTGKWTLIGPSYTTTGINPPSSTKAYFVQAQGSTKITISVTGGSGASTATLTTVESPNGTGCGNIAAVTPVFCPLVTSQTVNAGATAQILPAATGQAPYVCNFSVLFAAAPTAGSVSIVVGTGASCVTGTATLFVVPTSATTPLYPPSFVGTPLTGRFFFNGTDFVGDGLCITNSSATNATVNLSLAQF